MSELCVREKVGRREGGKDGVKRRKMYFVKPYFVKIVFKTIPPFIMVSLAYTV